MSVPHCRIRDAVIGDVGPIVSFNLRLALETEEKSLDALVLEQGVRTAIADPERLRYWVAESLENGAILGQTAVTREWSDWRNGWLWWFQSVYVDSDARGRGVFRALYTHVRELALQSGEVIGLRLYVEHANERAQKTYQALGMRPGGYAVYEEIWPERFRGQTG